MSHMCFNKIEVHCFALYIVLLSVLLSIPKCNDEGHTSQMHIAKKTKEMIIDFP